MQIDELKKNMEQMGEKTVEGLKYQFTKVRTGRASATILDGIMVDYYGTPTPLKQLGQVSTPEARLLQIMPFDKTMLEPIERAIQGANIGVNPSNDGNLIRLPFPALTEDKRKEIVKEMKKMGEDARIAMRNIRRDQNELVKKAEKDKKITEDESKKMQTEVQTITDKMIKKIDELVTQKEKEIMTI